MEYKWKFLNTFGNSISKEILKTIHNIFKDGFGREGWSLKGIKKVHKNSSIIGLLQNDTGNIIGYTFYYIPNQSLFGKYLLWNNATCIRKEFQGKGYYGTILIDSIINQFPDFDFGYTGGRSQNYKIFVRYQKLGHCYPFDNLYNDSNKGRKLMEYLATHIEEVKQIKQLDSRTGVAYKVYREGMLLNVNNKHLDGFEKINSFLERVNLNPNQGDALIVVSEL